MMRKSAKNVSQGKGHALSRPPSGGLTCSEWEVDDMLSVGESTEAAFTHRNQTSEAALAAVRNEQ
jgi:hypothetical protein